MSAGEDVVDLGESCPFTIFPDGEGWLVQCYYDGANRYTSYRRAHLHEAIDAMVADMKAEFGECDFCYWPAEENQEPLSLEGSYWEPAVANAGNIDTTWRGRP